MGNKNLTRNTKKEPCYKQEKYVTANENHAEIMQ